MALISSGSVDDKSKLSQKLREENDFLRDINNKKLEHIQQMKDRKRQLQEGIRNAEEEIKKKLVMYQKLKTSVEKAQRHNVKWL